MFLFADSGTAWPAIWAAIAATCSATAALILMRVHVLNRRDSVRPEIVFDGWSHDILSTDLSRICITKIRNEGRGPALHVRAELKYAWDKPQDNETFLVGLSHAPVSFIANGSQIDVDWMGLFVFKTLAGPAAIVPLQLIVYAHDLHGHRHQTTHDLIVTKDLQVAGVTNLGGGLHLTRRVAVIIPSWKSWLTGRKQRLLNEATGLMERVKNHKLLTELLEKAKKSDLLERFTGTKRKDSHQ